MHNMNLCQLNHKVKEQKIVRTDNKLVKNIPNY